MKSEEKPAISLMSLRGMRPDGVASYYSGLNCALTLRILRKSEEESHDLVLIEGEQQTLFFLADLILAQALDTSIAAFRCLPPALDRRSSTKLANAVFMCIHCLA